MADKDTAKFLASIEKYVADFAEDVNGSIEEFKKKLQVSRQTLSKQCGTLEIPAKGTVKEINEAVNDAVAGELKGLRGFMDIKLMYDFDEKTRKTHGCGIESTGTYTKLP